MKKYSVFEARYIYSDGLKKKEQFRDPVTCYDLEEYRRHLIRKEEDCLRKKGFFSAVLYIYLTYEVSDNERETD